MALVRHCFRALTPRSYNLTCYTANYLPRLFHTTSNMSKEQMDELAKNPFFDKYADKIAKLQKTSPEEFVARVEAQAEAKKPQPMKPKDFSLPSEPKALKAMGASGEKTLDNVMKLELLEDKTADEVAAIWTEFWSHKDAVSAAIPADVYKEMKERFNKFNTFLFPLPRDKGYEFVMVQIQGNQAHFSTLINFQAHRENAPECLGMVFYTELMETKGIVLMVGEFDNKVLDSKEAKYLADMLEIYYCKPSDSKLALLDKFTNQPTLFSHMDLINEMNSIALEPEAKLN